jgi:hypothetical protein
MRSHAVWCSELPGLRALDPAFPIAMGCCWGYAPQTRAWGPAPRPRAGRVAPCTPQESAFHAAPPVAPATPCSRGRAAVVFRRGSSSGRPCCRGALCALCSPFYVLRFTLSLASPQDPRRELHPLHPARKRLPCCSARRSGNAVLARACGGRLQAWELVWNVVPASSARCSALYAFRFPLSVQCVRRSSSSVMVRLEVRASE